MLWADVTRLVPGGGLHPAHPLGPDSEVWRVWPLAPLFLIPVVVVAVLYARGLMRWPERSRSHAWWRAVLFYSGLLVMVAAVNSPLHAVAERHFSAHMVQHLLVVTVGVPLVLLGAPTTPVLRGLPRVLRRSVVAPLAADPLVRRGFRLLTHPVTALVVFNGVMVAWHLVPGWYDRAAADELVHEVQHLSFAFSAALFWWNLIDPAPLHAPMGYLLRIGYVVVTGTIQSVLGAFITLADQPLYEYYVEATPLFDISPIDDQQLGGLIMWVPGQAIDLVVIGILFAVWWSQVERRQREDEALMDARAASGER